MNQYISWLVGSRALQLMTTLLVQLVLVRFFSPEQFGQFATLSSSITLWNLTLNLRLSLQVIKQERADLQLYWNGAVQEGLYLLVPIGIIYCTVHFSLQLFLILFSAFIFRIANVLQAFHERETKHLTLLKYEQMSLWTANSLTVLFAFLGMGTWVLPFRDLAINLVYLCCVLPRERLKYRTLCWAEWRGLIQDGRALWTDGLFEQCFLRSSVLIARFFGGDGWAGFYYQAQKLILIPHVHFCQMINRYAFHLLSRADSIESKEKIRKKLLLLLAPPLILGALLVIWKGKLWIPVFLGANWAPVSEIIQPMAGGLVFMTLFVVQKTYFLSFTPIHGLVASRLWQMGGFLLPLGLLPVYGLTAMGLSFSLSYFGAFLGSYYTLHRRVLVERGIHHIRSSGNGSLT